MAATDKRLPVGFDSFEKMIREDCYYLDKTGFIRQLLGRKGQVNLFTRPRRFGKTLNMTMLKAFFEIGADPSLFDGLEISRDRELCGKYQGQYPVLFFSLKGIDGRNFEDALGALAELLSAECQRLYFLMESDRLNQYDKERLVRYIRKDVKEADLKFAPAHLMRMLSTHYGRQVILLIDEYDVPLDKANDKGYYSAMVDFLRGFFVEAFKTNSELFFAVLTGCLRISKESIFTGLNNLKVDTIFDDRYDEYFGFTDADVRKILKDYGLSDAYGPVKEWYDGYRFGDTDVYCPWDVVCHCDKLLDSPDAEPDPYWDNTSSNQVIRRFVELADAPLKEEIERLIAGEAVEKPLILNLTYQELDKKEMLYSVLYQTGYLTLERNGGPQRRDCARFVIPNREVREIFVRKIREWFAEDVLPNHQTGLYDEVWNCRTDALTERIRGILYDTISCYDYHEDYYHALLAGLLHSSAYLVRSNDEMGSGRCDIAVEDRKGRRAVVIETKRSKGEAGLERDAEKALRQIEERQYAIGYQRKGYEVIIYGISFAGKECCVKGKRLGNE